MTSVFSRAALLAGVMTFGLTASALAADAPPGQGGKGERRVVIMRGPGGDGMHPGGMMMHGMDPEKHAQHLRDVLQLRPDQEGALKAFIAAMAPPEHPAPAADGAPPKPSTTPERLAMTEKRMAEHQAMFQRRAAAIRAFYAQLSPAQQKAFDALHQGGPGGRRIHMRRGAGGPGMEHPPHHPGGPGGEAMIWEGEGGPGGDAFFIGGPDDEAATVEIEIDGAPSR
ncbi:MAG: Spy/CpxP family protein refolding chaperone [Pseudomonadota bacterium]